MWHPHSNGEVNDEGRRACTLYSIDTLAYISYIKLYSLSTIEDLTGFVESNNIYEALIYLHINNLFYRLCSLPVATTTQ